MGACIDHEHLIELVNRDRDQAGAGAGAGAGGGLAAELEAERGRAAELQGRLEDRGRRLEVAQQQFAEYARQRSGEVGAISELAAAVASLASERGDAPLQEAAARLDGLLAEASAEARAFAGQQEDDLRRAGLLGAPGGVLKDGINGTERAGGQDADMPEAKRPRESQGPEDMAVSQDSDAMDSAPSGSAAAESFDERARYIPLRLDLRERQLLRLLEAALSVSEYTDKVDILSYRSKSTRIHQQIRHMCAILSGLVVAQNYRKGQQLVQDKQFKENAEFFQEVFEVGRRHKVMNPERMRGTYGKLVYLLQDSRLPDVLPLLEFDCVRPLRTVRSLLEERGGLALLGDGLVAVATAEISADGKPRHQIDREIKEKERARKTLAQRYRSEQLTEDDILLCLYSISDNNSYLFFNRDPIDRMLAYMDRYFDPDSAEEGFSLAISGGVGGARLSHNHRRQYQYARQSLTLWREIMHDMYRLWYLAEEDLLSGGNGYRLLDTGQGLNRVQQAPRVSRAIHAVLRQCQQRLGDGWVGSSVIHLGDHNVPNALLFIDKYTQVPRILAPLARVLDEAPRLSAQAGITDYIQATFGGAERLQKAILADFFRHAFDGSGADNFFDAGSCIDGRLTSAWNWCAKLEKKPFYPIFKLAGFSGFDGSFGTE